MEDSMSRETGSPLSRRKFAALAAGCGATANLIAQDVPQNISNTPAPEDRRRGPRPDIAPFSETLAFSRRLVEDKVRAFPMNAVRLTAGIFKDAEESNRAVLHRLPVDRLVHNFRVNAGLASSATPLGGWEAPDCELRGHFTGHFLSACALLYASTGDQEWRAYVTGGTSNGEGLRTEPRRLAAELKLGPATTECCCAYNMLKLTRHLYSWTADPRYFDYYERTLYNHRLGTIRKEDGATMYYLSIVPGAWKTFNTEYDSFWCCTGTGVEEYAKLNDSIYFHDEDGVYVNLFIPSELKWAEKGVTLRQQTAFPNEPSTTLTISAEKPVDLAVRLRIPYWLTSGGSVKINGKPLEAIAGPGSYLTIARKWRNGDRIEMDASDEPACGGDAGRRESSGAALRPAGARGRARIRGPDRGDDHRPGGPGSRPQADERAGG